TGTLQNIAGVATAVFTTGVTQLTGGSHSIFAVYGGDTSHEGSTSSSVTQTVLQHATTTIINIAGPKRWTIGEQVTFTATVSTTIGSVLPSGTVDFKEGATVLGTGTLNNIGGVATVTFTTASPSLRAAAIAFSRSTTPTRTTPAARHRLLHRQSCSTPRRPSS